MRSELRLADWSASVSLATKGRTFCLMSDGKRDACAPVGCRSPLHYSFGCFLTTFGSFVFPDDAAWPSGAPPAAAPGLCVFGFGRRLPKVPRWIFPRFDR